MADQINLLIEAVKNVATMIQRTQSYIDAHTWDFTGEVLETSAVSAAEGRVQVDTELISAGIADTTTTAAIFQILTALADVVNAVSNTAAVFSNETQFAGSVVASVSTNAGIISDAHTKFYATADGVSGANGGFNVTTQLAGTVGATTTTVAEFFREG